MAPARGGGSELARLTGSGFGVADTCDRWSSRDYKRDCGAPKSPAHHASGSRPLACPRICAPNFHFCNFLCEFPCVDTGLDDEVHGAQGSVRVGFLVEECLSASAERGKTGKALEVVLDCICL